MFPAYYDGRTARGLERRFAEWQAGYFKFARPVLRTYLALENKVANAGCRNLATHYCVTATR